MIDLSDVTPRVQRLPRDARLRHRRCWVCGEPLGRHVAFVCGPTTAITLKTSEPGSHLECARAAVRICPYIMFPQRSRDEPPPGVEQPAGVVTLKRNPGVWMLYVATDFSPVQHGR